MHVQCRSRVINEFLRSEHDGALVSRYAPTAKLVIHAFPSRFCTRNGTRIVGRRLFANRGAGYILPSTMLSNSIRGMASPASTPEYGAKHVSKGVMRIFDGVIAQGKGSYLRFEDGRTMLDFTCGIGVVNLGRLLPCVQPP
jgi:hypothetical protein